MVFQNLNVFFFILGKFIILSIKKIKVGQYIRMNLVLIGKLENGLKCMLNLLLLLKTV